MVSEVNTIQVNFMTRAVGRFVNREHGAGRSGTSMANAIAEAARRAAGADGSEDTRRNGAPDTAGAGGENTKESAAQYAANRNAAGGGRAWMRTDAQQRIGLGGLSQLDRSIREAMTMDEYREYIRERILALPMHGSHMQDTITITISDEGLAAMKRDAEYEEWVINDLRTGWAWENPWARYLGGAYSLIHYGATKEECHAEMWNAGFRHGDGRSIFESMSGDDDKNDKKRKSEIIVKPDGTRYLVISEVIGGMKVTVMSVKLTEADELMQGAPDLGDPDLGDSGAAWSFGDI